MASSRKGIKNISVFQLRDINSKNTIKRASTRKDAGNKEYSDNRKNEINRVLRRAIFIHY